jgi:hypothetical protein
LVTEQQRSRRPARHARQDLEPEIGSCSAGSDRAREEHPAVRLLLFLVVRCNGLRWPDRTHIGSVVDRERESEDC